MSISTPNETKMSRLLEERIRRRAEELYRLRKDGPGSALDDWLSAEKEVALEEQAVDASLEESFPASDPPAISPPLKPDTEPKRRSERGKWRGPSR